MTAVNCQDRGNRGPLDRDGLVDQDGSVDPLGPVDPLGSVDQDGPVVGLNGSAGPA